MLCSVQLALSSLYNSFLGAILGEATPKVNVAHASANDVSIPKRLHKPLLYKWLTSGASTSAYETLFQPQSSAKVTDKLPSLYHNLYKTIYMSKLSTPNLDSLNSVIGDSRSSMVSTSDKSLVTLIAEHQLFGNPTSLCLDTSVE